MTGTHEVACRICGRPGRLYLSGRWCGAHSPHDEQPAPPPPAPRVTGVTQTAVHEAHRLHTAWRVARKRADATDAQPDDDAATEAHAALLDHLDSTGLAGSRYDPRPNGA